MVETFASFARAKFRRSRKRSAVELSSHVVSRRELLGRNACVAAGRPTRSRRVWKAKSQRMATQPHGAAGCFFKNAPASPLGTGKMIDELGMKGTRRGGAVVSPKHANFIVTEGDDARAADALALAEEIREKVKREHGIDLEYEVELWSSK